MLIFSEKVYAAGLNGTTADYSSAASYALLGSADEMFVQVNAVNPSSQSDVTVTLDVETSFDGVNWDSVYSSGGVAGKGATTPLKFSISASALAPSGPMRRLKLSLGLSANSLYLEAWVAGRARVPRRFAAAAGAMSTRSRSEGRGDSKRDCECKEGGGDNFPPDPFANAHTLGGGTNPVVRLAPGIRRSELTAPPPPEFTVGTSLLPRSEWIRYFPCGFGLPAECAGCHELGRDCYQASVLDRYFYVCADPGDEMNAAYGKCLGLFPPVLCNSVLQVSSAPNTLGWFCDYPYARFPWV